MPKRAPTKRENREYLNFVVFEHLNKMPTADEFTADKHAELNFNIYYSHHYDRSEHACEINDQYDCGLVGCLAGWYLMMSDRDNRLPDRERRYIRSFDTYELANHFGISHEESRKLFSALSERATHKGSLHHRRGVLNQIMHEMGDFDDQ